MNKALKITLILVIILAVADGLIYFEKDHAAAHTNSVSTLATTTATMTPAASTTTAAVLVKPANTGAQPAVAAKNPTPITTSATVTTLASTFPVHTNITATVFWVGEPVGNGSSEDNSISAWDDDWEKDYGGYDDYQNRNGYFPAEFTPKQNPFYLDLPYDDFDDNGDRRPDAYNVVPWAETQTWPDDVSMMKNRWVKITKDGATCYGQIEDSGPYVYDDYNYVFSTTDARPASQQATNAGMDVSPALRDCLSFNGLNNDENKVDWQFVNASDVPAGPWKEIVTTSNINWH
jgi:hypothetical protein